MKKAIRVNERGIRIGESHPNARLSDVEVELLLGDRESGMSLAALAKKWHISKSGAKKICDGTCRGQIGQFKKKEQTKIRKAEVKLSVPLAVRAKIHRLGGCAWVEQIVSEANEPAILKSQVRMKLALSLRARAKLYRLGFSEWLTAAVEKHAQSHR